MCFNSIILLMKKICSSGILFNTPCCYGGEIDLSKHGYGVTKRGDQVYYYHYMCYIKNPLRGIFITRGAQDLIRRLIGGNKFSDPKDIILAEEILNAVKY